MVTWLYSLALVMHSTVGSSWSRVKIVGGCRWLWLLVVIVGPQRRSVGLFETVMGQIMKILQIQIDLELQRERSFSKALGLLNLNFKVI
jgi:hypothetical protein